MKYITKEVRLDILVHPSQGNLTHGPPLPPHSHSLRDRSPATSVLFTEQSLPRQDDGGAMLWTATYQREEGM